MDDEQFPQVYVLSEDERSLVHDGPALVGSDGVHHGIPPRVYEAMRLVEEILRAGDAVQIRRFPSELGTGEAAGAVDMSADDLRAYVEDGSIPSHERGGVTMVNIADVVAFDRQLRVDQADAMQALADQEPWEEPRGRQPDSNPDQG